MKNSGDNLGFLVGKEIGGMGTGVIFSYGRVEVGVNG